MGISIYQLQYLKLAFDFESFFAQDSPDKQFYDEHKKAFGYDNDYLLLIIEAENRLFSSSVFTALDQWQKQASRIEGVEKINSPLSLKRVIETPFGLTAYPLIHFEDSTKLAADSSKIAQHPLYKQYFSFERKAMIAVIQHVHFTDKKVEEDFLKQLKASLNSSNLSKTSLVGRLTAQQSFVENIKHDFIWFSSLALILSAIILLLIYRSFRLMLVPYLMSVTAMLFTLGLTSMLGIPLSILSVLLPTIILFVSTSDAIHLLNSFRHTQKSSHNNRLSEAVHKVLIPTFLTSLTTAIGFISLIFLPSSPIKQLGILAATGVLLAFIVNFLFAPLLLAKNYKRAQGKLPWKALTVIIFRNRKLIYVIFGVFILLSAYFTFQLNTDSYLLRDLPEDDEVRLSFELVDNSFGGSKPWEIALWPTDSLETVWNAEFMNEVNKISSYLNDSLDFGRVVAPSQLLKYANQVNKGGLVGNYAYPDENAQNLMGTAEKLNRYLNGAVINQEGNYARILAFMPDWGASKTTRKNEKLVKFISDNVDQKVLGYRLTGTSFLIDKNNELVSLNLLKGLLIAIGLISIILAVYFRSFKILLISLIPNLVPLLITAGLMGLMQVPIKLTTTIIFVVAFSIAVDDTIHFIASYKKQSAKNHIWNTLKTFRLAGLSIIITTLIIVSGFSLFILSSFATTFYLGLFLSLSLLIALLTDIFLLPIILPKNR
jgi:predicted RND superfamily exporter protein